MCVCVCVWGGVGRRRRAAAAAGAAAQTDLRLETGEDMRGMTGEQSGWQLAEGRRACRRISGVDTKLFSSPPPARKNSKRDGTIRWLRASG